MSKKCANCDCLYNDDSFICPKCGATEVHPPRIERLKNRPFGKLIITIGGLAAIAIVLLLFSLAFNRPYQSALDNYYAYTISADEDAYEALAPEEYWDWYEERHGVPGKDPLGSQSNRGEFYEDFIGDDIHISYDFENVTKYSDHQVELFAEALEDTYDIDADSVTRAYSLSFTATIKGEHGTEVMPDMNLRVIEIDGNWYIFSYSAGGDELYIRFAV